MEYIAHGKLGEDIVTHQMASAQSASDAFPLFKSLGSDDEPFQRNFFSKALEHEDHLMKDGAKLTSLSTRPPVVWTFDKKGHEQTQILGVAENVRPAGTRTIPTTYL